ncbi:hypothetical protein [[Kitasatospora] papulosa]|uniref:hypothetical protein n=1 Tax=[Kitasatospora] papulosa TaxID=1464011 RepID=UPI00362BC52B
MAEANDRSEVGTAEGHAPVPVPAPGAPFAAKLNFLFDRVRPKGGEEFSNAHVARTISSYGDVSYTGAWIGKLRNGAGIPTITIVPLFARFFGVEAAYFVEDETTRKIATQFEILRKLQEEGVQHIAMRAMGVSAAGQRKVLQALDAVRKEEGLPAELEEELPS